MEVTKIIKQKQAQLEQQPYLHFSGNELAEMEPENVSAIESHFGGHALMKLPQEEIDFFEWVKKVDFTVWQDLWDGEEEPYLVSISFLHHFLQEQNGFPICDLIEEDNYWFCKRHLKPKGLEIIANTNQPSISFEELLIGEIIQQSIDIWHFCYRNNISLKFAKAKVQDMHHKDLLVHLENREDLVKYLDI
jgi:hypothetical protein